MKHYSFPKINQYHQVLRGLKLHLSYVGKDENGEAFYKEPDVWPTLKFVGKIKNHGTNSGIVFSKDGSFYCQSRERIIDEISDNAGFAHFINKQGYKIFNEIKNKFVEGVKHVILYSEWAGGSIQKGVALNLLPKMMIVFGCKLIFEDDTTEWVNSSGIRNHEISVYNISDYPIYEIEIDLNRPDKAIEQMNKWVEEIDKECPFAKALGVSGTGEGIVMSLDGDFSFTNSFKCKGLSHSKSKIKKLPTVDVQKMDTIQELAQSITPEWRLNQAVEKVCNTLNGGIPDMSHIGELLRWVNKDIIAEEYDKFTDPNITLKDLFPHVAKISRNYFIRVIQNWDYIKSN